MSRKHMPLLIGGAVALLLAIALFYLLFSAKGRYAEEASLLSRAQGQLRRLSSREVFPSESNVQTMGKQLGIYREYLDGLYASIREGQSADEPIDRDRFRRLLEEGLRRLLNDAREKSVALAPDLAFGVQRYVEGATPADEELPRLVDQFRSIASLCDILYAAGIGELTAVERTVFEKEAQVAPVEEGFSRRTARGGRSEAAAPAVSTELYRDPDGLFTKEHFALSYRAQDAATWKVLDRLSKGAPFVVVTKVDIANPARPAVVLPKAAEKAPPPPKPVASGGWSAPGSAAPGSKEEPVILPRELRVVAGQELCNVRLEVDLYRFAAVARAGEGEVNP